MKDKDISVRYRLFHLIKDVTTYSSNEKKKGKIVYTDSETKTIRYIFGGLFSWITHEAKYTNSYVKQ